MVNRWDSQKWHVSRDRCLQCWLECKFERYSGERWSEVSSLLHIYVLELMAIEFALLSLCNKIDKVHICIKSNYSSAVSYFINQGRSLMSLRLLKKLSIVRWKKHCEISSSRSGKNNITADYLSGHSVIQQNGNFKL